MKKNIIKIFITNGDKPEETETIVQKWIDSFDASNNSVQIEHSSQVCLGNNMIHLILFYKLIPKSQ